MPRGQAGGGCIGGTSYVPLSSPRPTSPTPTGVRLDTCPTGWANTAQSETWSALPSRPAFAFVVQEHHASSLHWDLRLEHDGALASWALPKGIPTHPKENRLAVRTEDHPLEYLEFHGEIPKGSYGAGTMEIWDSGTYEAEKFRADEVIVTLHGERAQGRYALFQTKGKNWMIHRMDPPADPAAEPMPDHIEPMLAKNGEAPARRGLVRVRDQVGRRARGGPRRRGPPHPHRPPRHGLHAALSGGAGDGERAGVAAADPRRRGGGVRFRGPAELRAAPVAHAPGVGLGGAAADEGRARRLRRLRPAVAGGPLHARPALRRPAQAARRARAGGPELAGARRTARATAPRCSRPARRRASRASWPSGSTRRTSPGRRSSSWIKVKNRPSEDVVIGGWLPGEGRRGDTLGALAVGRAGGGGKLKYAGQGGHRLHRGHARDADARAGAAEDRRVAVRGPPAPQGHDLRGAAADRRGGVRASGRRPAPCGRRLSRG